MKTQNPWMGRARGSAGSMTSTKINDKNVMKAKAFEVSNPNTEAQQTERNFFKQVLALTSSFSQEELRSLFGTMPKGMSRRNMLYQQISAANTLDGNTKQLDFSKLFTIGNGKTTDAAIYYIDSVAAESYDLEEDETTLKVAAGQNPNLLFVVFNVTKGTIAVYNTEDTLTDNVFVPASCGCAEGDEVYFYPTVAENGADVSSLAFGNFALKTRPNKQGRFVELIVPQPAIESVPALVPRDNDHNIRIEKADYPEGFDRFTTLYQGVNGQISSEIPYTLESTKSSDTLTLSERVSFYLKDDNKLYLTFIDRNEGSQLFLLEITFE